MEVDWRSLSVTIGQTQVLSPMSGELRPRRMVALMGPSGSGKTTFLSCLQQDISYAGEVRFDGQKFAPYMRKSIGFVEQDDVVIPALTVKQSLMFLAELRFGVNSKEASACVEKVLAKLRLTKIADSIVGEPGARARISGGERKRLCIARELLGEPRLLIADEPTSGLDSSMAAQVITSLRNLCDSGSVTIVASIHQPSTSIFAQFDNLLLLKEGELLYWGPAQDAEALFLSHGLQRHPSQSTAEYLMDLMVCGPVPEVSPEEDPELGKTTTGCAPSLSKEVQNTIAGQMAKQAVFAPLGSPSAAKCNQQTDMAPASRQLYLLSRRMWRLYSIQSFSKMMVVQNSGLMLLSFLLWWQLDFHEEDVRARWTLCFWTCGQFMFFPMFGSLGTFQELRKVLEKELRMGCYSVEAFYVARAILLYPLEIVWPTCWCTVVFWLTNVNPDFLVFVQFLCVVYIDYAMNQAVGFAISASGIPNAQRPVVAILWISYCFGWNDFFVSADRLPSFLRWLHYANPFGYILELLFAVVVPDHLQFKCQVVDKFGILKVGAGCEHDSRGNLVITGTRARELHSRTTATWVCLLVPLAAMVLLRLFVYVSLRRGLRVAIHGAQGKPATTHVEPEPVQGTKEGDSELAI